MAAASLFSVIQKVTLVNVIHTSLFLFTCELVVADFSAFENYLCLQQHNLYRSRTKGHYDYNGQELKTPCNMEQMRWSRCLAQLAQVNVDKCSTAHTHGKIITSRIFGSGKQSTLKYKVNQKKERT